MPNLHSSRHSLWLGLTPYDKALEIQESLLQRCLNEKNFYLLGLEHPPTITLGKRGKENIDIVWSETQLQAHGLETFRIDRGGEATLHAPGQLVIYPIVHLPSAKISVKAYVQLLISTTRTCLQELGIETQCHPQEPGLFVGDQKLVAFGIRVKKGVTQHGLAINVSNNIKLFEGIRSCGVAQQKWTHLRALGCNISLRNLFINWQKEFLLTQARSED